MESSTKTCGTCLTFMSLADGHQRCIKCLGRQHAELALPDPSYCAHCRKLGAEALVHRLQVVSCSAFGPAANPSTGADAVPPPVSPASRQLSPSPPPPAGLECFAGDLPRDEHLRLVDLHSAQWPQPSDEEEEEEERPSSHRALLQRELHQLVARAVAKLGVSWPDPAPPPPSMLSGAYFVDAAPQPTSSRPLPVLQDVSTEVRASWGAPHKTRAPIQQFAPFSALASEPELGYTNLPPLEDPVAAHLCPSSSTAKPQLPSKPCRVTAALAEKAYKSAGQSAALLNTICLLQAYQAYLLRDLEGRATPEVYVELRKATDLCLHLARGVAQNQGRIMGFSVVTHRHLWLNLTQIPEKEKSRLLDAPITTSGLFGPVINSFAHQFEQKEKEKVAISRLMPRRARSPQRPEGRRAPPSRSNSGSASRGRPPAAAQRRPRTQSPAPAEAEPSLPGSSGSTSMNSWRRRPFRQQQSQASGRGKQRKV